MSMKENGLVKLSEECAEVIQVAQKMIQYPDLQLNTHCVHPDGTILRDKLTEEIGDALAAIEFIISKLNLNTSDIQHRLTTKLLLFRMWDKE